VDDPRFPGEGEGPEYETIYAMGPNCLIDDLAAKDLGVAPVGILEYLNAATGADYTLEEPRQAGEHIINAERLFLTQAGFTRKDDSLPARPADQNTGTYRPCQGPGLPSG
jgi:aldehyde:ferredoxin oxidoreductase